MATHLDKFDFLEELGRGGYGVVYKVKYKPAFKNPTIYALKIVHFAKGTLVRSEIDSISAVCMTDCPYVVKAYNYWYEFEMDPKFDKYCILMEYCDTNLSNYIRKRYVQEKSHFTENEIWEIICHIMEGVRKCHESRYTHRDLKPQNILYSSKTRTWKLSDFGIAARIPNSVNVVPVQMIHSPIPNPSFPPSPPHTPPPQCSQWGRSPQLTAVPPAGSHISHGKRGTPGYVAPELLYNGIFSAKGDIWSIGCILYELASGKMAFPPQLPNGCPDPLRLYFVGQKSVPEVTKEDNPRIMTPVGKNFLGSPVSGRYRINQVVSWCLETDASDRPKVERLIRHVKSIVLCEQ